MEEPFGERTLELQPGDTLVLATDGLTEVRNRAGEQLYERGAMELIDRARPHAQQLADELVAEVRALGGNRVRDDLAVLAIRLVGGEGGMRKFRARVLLALIACWCSRRTAALADCKVHRGDHVVLYSTTDDPSVLMWDSRARLRPITRHRSTRRRPCCRMRCWSHPGRTPR